MYLRWHVIWKSGNWILTVEHSFISVDHEDESASVQLYPLSLTSRFIPSFKRRDPGHSYPISRYFIIACKERTCFLIIFKLVYTGGWKLMCLLLPMMDTMYVPVYVIVWSVMNESMYTRVKYLGDAGGILNDSQHILFIQGQGSTIHILC